MYGNAFGGPAAREAAAANKVGKGTRGGSWQGHNGAVSGVAVDAVNKTMVSAGVDGLLVFWAFREKRADGAVTVGSGVSQLELVRAEMKKREDVIPRYRAVC